MSRGRPYSGEPLNEDQKADLKRRFSRLDALPQSEQAIRGKALAISERFRRHRPDSRCSRWVLRHFLREMKEGTGAPADRKRAQRFILGQIDSIHWPPDPPDPEPARRVEVGDEVYVYDFESREIVTWVVVGTEPDWEKGEVSRDSPIGYALLGAHEGEEREVGLPGQEPKRIRIVLIADA